jgi:hypothetical protein
MKLFAIAAIAWFIGCDGIAMAESAVFWVSGPVRSGETVLATGYFPQSQQISLKVANIEHTAGDWRSVTSANGIRVTPLKITETSIMFVLPDLGGDGVYGFRVDQPHEAPVYARVNLPEVWWTLAESPSTGPEVEARIDVDSASAGARLRLFGRCLTHGGVAGDIRLTSQSGKTIGLKATNDGSYELTTKLPNDLAPGIYSLEVRSPRGGGAVASAPRLIQIEAAAETHLAELSVADFGAREDPHFDNSAAFKAALLKAADLGGAVLKIPAGYYFLSQPIEIPPNVYLVGESRLGERPAPLRLAEPGDLLRKPQCHHLFRHEREARIVGPHQVTQPAHSRKLVSGPPGAGTSGPPSHATDEEFGDGL